MTAIPPSSPVVNVENNQGVVAQHIGELHLHNPPSQPYGQQVADYYRKVAKECRITTMDDHHPAGRQYLSNESAIDQVYVEPDVWKVTIESSEAVQDDPPEMLTHQAEHRERMTWQSCFESKNENLRRLLLVADGGMGKTTAVDVQIQRLVDAGNTPWMALRLPRVLVVGSKVGDDDVVEVALSYDIASKLDLATSKAKTLAHEVLDRLDKQPGVILLDALDEVPLSERKRVISGVLRFLNRMWDRQPNHKVLITSRPYAVEDGSIHSDLKKFDFVKLELARLSKEQRGELVQRYFAVRGRDAKVGAALLRQLDEHGAGEASLIAELMREPMLATYACMLAEGRASAAAQVAVDTPLPTSRYELLEGVVHLLLERWDVERRGSAQTSGFKTMFRASKPGGRSPLRLLLEQAALQEHLYAAQADAARRSDAARPVSHGFPVPDEMELGSLYEAVYHGDAHEALGADWLIARIDEQMLDDMPLRAHHIYEWLTRRSGLVGLELDSRGRARPRLHRQWGDFLAAAGLWDANMDASEYASELVHRLQVSPDWSRDLIAQGWERLVASANGDPKKLVPALTSALGEWESWCESVNQVDCEAGTATLSLALARALPVGWLKNNLPLYATLHALRQRLVTILAEQRLAAPERAAAADALGTLGDPRFAPGLWLPSDRFGHNNAVDEPLPGFVRVPAGRFWIGEEREVGDIPEVGEVLNPPHEANLESDFYIARCLTTVAQYQRFVDAGAYGAWGAEKDVAVWGESGLAWRMAARREGTDGQAPLRHPRRWAGQLPYPHRPAIDLSWWEARAYARWLNTDSEWQLAQSSVVAWANHHVCLPTELQWERAARLDTVGGAHRQRWPWGDDTEGFAQRANVRESGVSDVSPVGCFAPNPFGIWDLCGNALEWTDNAGEDPAYAPQRLEAADEPSLDNNRKPALRGGAYPYAAEAARASIRFRYFPDDKLISVGFRVVLSLALQIPKT